MKNSKKTFFILALFLISLSSYSQFHPIKNLSWSQWYNYPNNFYTLKWSPPDTSFNDTLIGYNIYRNNELYRFWPDTIAQHIIPQDTSFGGDEFLYLNEGAEFFIHVTAVYNFNHIESIYNDSALCHGAALKIVDIKEELIRIYPNPFSTVVFINSSIRIKSVEIYNAQGVVIKRIECSPIFDLKIETSDLIKGTYFIRVVDEWGDFYTYTLTR